MSLIAELKRRNVFRVGAAYAIVAWLLVEVASVVLPTFEAPDWVMKVFTFMVILGFPLALILAWAFELTPEGIKLETAVDRTDSSAQQTSRKLDFAIIGLLVIAVVFLVVDDYILESQPEHASSDTEIVSAEELGVGNRSAAEERSVASGKSVARAKSVAVLPFADLSPAGDYEWFSDGLSEEILNSLSHLPELMVSARTSSFRFKGQDRAIGEIAQVLGVAHVVEGSVRRGGDQLRVTAQLIRASDEFHLWSETYDRAAEDVFAVQEEIAEKVAAALDVVLDDDKRERMFRTGTRNVQAFEAYRRARAIYDAVHDDRTDEDLFDANRWLERAIEFDPDYSAAHLMHSDAYTHFLMSRGEHPMAPRSGAPDLTDEEALERLRIDMGNAYQTARDPGIKVAMDYTRTVFSDSWHRLPALMRALDDLQRSGRVLNDEGSWFGFQAVVGDAESYLARTRKRQLLNPLFGLPWAQSTLVLITLDRHAEAIEEVRRARGIAGDSPNLTYREALARVLSGDLDTAVSLLSTGIFTVEVDAKACRAVARALEGREVEARRLAAEVEAQISHYEELLWVYHQLGDEEEVARLAREIDAEPLGPQQLLISLSMHGSRMLFSLDDAPNFRARLAEMGLDASRFQPMPRFAVTDEGTGK